MLCKNPYQQGVRSYPCGQCMPCRIRKRREWAHRIMLEASQHEHSCFVTLSYNERAKPADGSVNPKEFQDWMKRLRRRIEPLQVRYFGVGEYGDKTERPHYHVALFGYQGCLFGQSRYNTTRLDCCPQCDLIRDSWGRGFVYLGDLNVNSAEYVAGYTTKKMTRADDLRLNGRHPEFARMSLRPGIGADAMHEVASTLLKKKIWKLIRMFLPSSFMGPRCFRWVATSVKN